MGVFLLEVYLLQLPPVEHQDRARAVPAEDVREPPPLQKGDRGRARPAFATSQREGSGVSAGDAGVSRKESEVEPLGEPPMAV